MIVPAYFHPAVAAAEWAALNTMRPSAVVLNVSSGPGSARDPLFAEALAGLDGIAVLGYLDTGYGDRPPASLEAEMAAYRDWYGVTGFFLDQVASGAEWLAQCARLTAAARMSGGPVVLNHGTYPDPGYAELADLLVTFEGPWTAYEQLYPPDWAMELPASRFCHLVYATPPAEARRAFNQAVRCNAGIVYVTDRSGGNPWDGLPSYEQSVEPPR